MALPGGSILSAVSFETKVQGGDFGEELELRRGLDLEKTSDE